MEERVIDVNYHPLTASVPIKGEILDKWESLGSKTGILGCPLCRESILKNNCRMQKFQKGVIVYHPEYGAHTITGKFYYYWADNLGVVGPYNYPKDDPEACGGITIQNFTGGTIKSDDDCIINGIDLRGEFARREIAIRNQGSRGTCSVQVIIALQEYLYSGLLGNSYAYLSAEYANHFANVASGDRDDGHCFITIAQGYDEYGIIRNSLWPYNKDWVYNYDEGQRFVTSDMINTGRQLTNDGLRLKGRFIKGLDGKVGLSNDQFAEFISVLDSGIPAGVGRDHSLTAVGYKRDITQPGGGIIIFRNSWGTNSDFTGYQTETFEHVINTVNDIYVYEI
ncbi:MAG: hypothetical protein ACYCWE_07055 [Eubacteriales bacterium]